MASSFLRFLDHTQRRITVGRTPLDEWSARRRDLYLTTHTTLTTDKHLCPPVGFEPTISASERPQTYALDRAATGTGRKWIYTAQSSSVACARVHRGRHVSALVESSMLHRPIYFRWCAVSKLLYNFKALLFHCVSETSILQKISSSAIRHSLRNVMHLTSMSRTRRCAVGWGTVLQTGRSQVRSPMMSMEFFKDIIPPAALWLWDQFGNISRG